MTDGIAIFIVFIGLAALLYGTFRHFGSYEDQITLGPGYYEVGPDIPPGKCDVKAASGGGNFILRNGITHAWDYSSHLGVTSGLQPSRFRNLRLGLGDTLEINNNLTVLLTPPVPIRNPAKEPLCAGVYRFGVDIRPGRYDLEVVSGDGDVLLVDVRKDNYNFYQDMSLENPFKAHSFKNVFCTTEFELWVSGSLQLLLKPSKRQLLLWQMFKPR